MSVQTSSVTIEAPSSITGGGTDNSYVILLPTAVPAANNGVMLFTAGTGTTFSTSTASFGQLTDSTTSGTTTLPTTTSTSFTTGHIVSVNNGGTGVVDFNDSGTALSSLAPLSSPTFTGTPSAPTASSGTNTTQLATTAFVYNANTRILAATNAGGVNGSTTTFGFVTGVAALGPTESVKQIALPVSCTVANLYVTTSGAQPGSGSLVTTLRLAGANQTLAVTILAGDPAETKSDTTHSFSYTAGQLLNMQIQNNATATSANMTGWSLTCEGT